MAHPIRVMHLIAGLSAGGAEVMLKQLVSAMDPLRFENSVVSMTNGGIIAEQLKSRGVGVECLAMRRGIPDPAGWVRLNSRLRRFRPEVLQTWMYHANLLGSLIIRNWPPTRLVWGLHHSNLSWKMNKAQTLLVVRACALLSHRAPDAIVCCSEAARRAHYAVGYDSEKLVVIPNGYDTGTFQPDEQAAGALRRELGIPEASPVISLIARFHPQKNHRCFIQAASIVNRIRPDAHFVLAGAGADNENPILAEWIALSGATQRFHLLGPIQQVQHVMAGSTVVASASAGEAMSNVIGEAMACGAVCVVTDVGDSAAVMGDRGVVVAANDPKALAAGVLSALALTPEARRSLGRAARQRIEENFGLSRTVSEYEALYEQVARNPNEDRDLKKAS